MVTTINTLEEFEKYLENKDHNDKLIVVDFTATWCGPCKAMAPVFEEQSAAAANKNVIFLKVDVDKAAEVAEKYKISAMPTFMFFKNAELVDEIVGANKVLLVQKIERLRT